MRDYFPSYVHFHDTPPFPSFPHQNAMSVSIAVIMNIYFSFITEFSFEARWGEKERYIWRERGKKQGMERRGDLCRLKMGNQSSLISSNRSPSLPRPYYRAMSCHGHCQQMKMFITSPSQTTYSCLTLERK